MNVRHFAIWWTVALLTGMTAGAAYLEIGGEGPAEHEVVPVPPHRPIPPPPPPPPHRELALPTLLANIDIGDAWDRAGLTVYPLVLRQGDGDQGLLTLDEALTRGQLDVREQDAGRVPALLVANRATRPVFLMAGESLLGGKQNRLVRDDVLLPPRSGFVAVDVYCGEQHRWDDSPAVFKSGAALSAPALRGMAAEAAPQDRIWGEIDGQLRRAGVESGTRSYEALYENARIGRELDRCVAAFGSLCGPRTVGCIVAVHGRILGAEVFSDAGLFARLWPKICRSYAVDGILGPTRWGERDEVLERRWPSATARRFLDGMRTAHYEEAGTPGMGRLWRLAGRVSGSDLEHGARVVHAGAFPGRMYIEPRPGR